MKYVIDIDDTILFSELLDSGKYEIKYPNKELIQIITELYKDNNEIILHTARHWNHLSITQNQLSKYSVPYDTLVMGKPVGDCYIDDKGIKPEDFILNYRSKSNE